MGDRKRAQEDDAPDSVSSAPESGQPAGGREPPGEPFTRRREAPEPREGEAGHDAGEEPWRAADGSDEEPGSAPARRKLAEEKDDD
jgi:hypothetical protein